MSSHAALPFGVPLGGRRLRVLFSPRDTENRARIGALTLDLSGPAPRVEAVEPKPLLDVGEAGAFDESGCTMSCLVRHEGRELLYYSGWTRGVTVPFYFYVGLATSDDAGRTFRRVSRAPVLERSEADPFLTASPFVLVERDLWRMWYVSGTGWRASASGPQHRYHIKYAESRDGVRWDRRGVVAIDFASDDEYALARPTVLKDDRYRMWFACRGEKYRIGYAESMDGVRWERRDEDAGIEPSGTGWDSDELAYPHVVDLGDGERVMLYNGNGYGRSGFGVAREEARPTS
ncbi:MAG TPA: hypothetical protein VFF73_42045 [Planctomycetota bacterium]|nr:hypothetical protein [Planctomycetota bacterium]